jgi:hypothetical protein
MFRKIAPVAAFASLVVISSVGGFLGSFWGTLGCYL